MNGFTLPGAEAFAQYLEDQTGEPLVITRDKRTRCWGHWGKRYWIETKKGVEIGCYTRYNRTEDDPNGIRAFEGHLLGYVNQKIAENTSGDPDAVGPINSIHLTYGPVDMGNGQHRSYFGEISPEGFARIDGHTTIPFP